MSIALPDVVQTYFEISNAGHGATGRVLLRRCHGER